MGETCEMYLERFIKTVKNRTEMHKKGFFAVSFSYSLKAGIIRFELDSLLRSSFLCFQPVDNREDYARIFCETGKFCDPKNGKRITDKPMVDHVNGWVGRAHDSLNGFAHLSYLHEDTPEADLAKLLGNNISEVEDYLLYYHERKIQGHLKIYSLEPFLDSIFEKIYSNNECYIESLENSERTERIL